MKGFLPALILLGVPALPVAAMGGEPAPKLELVDRASKPVSLEAFRGKVVVLDFWAPWCEPCRKSFPFLDGLQKKHAAQGLQVVGVTLEADVEAIGEFLDAFPVGFVVARDPSEKAGDAYDIVAMPTTILLDREGGVAARFEGGGEAVHRKLEVAVEGLLAGRALPAGTDVLVSANLQASAAVPAWRRGYLADAMMNLDGDPLTRILREHVHASKEGAAGTGGASGGGCGCN